MGVLSPTPVTVRNKKAKALAIPTIDLSQERSNLTHVLVKACEDYGFFKVVNHGVPKQVIAGLEQESTQFFARPSSEKEYAGPAAPFGYGCKNIGLNGDMGELEYLLLHTNPLSISERSKTISSSDPTNFRSAVHDYIEAIRELTCEILDLVAEGMWLQDKFVFSKLIRDINHDSVLRINHYPPIKNDSSDRSSKLQNPDHCNKNHIGFGEHSDPQILTILRSNDVGGLQICTQNGVWLPVPPDPNEFFVMVGDAFQVLTNGRFRSVRHRALTNTVKARMSMMYFGAPPLHSWITPVQNMVTPQKPSLYKPFTWGDYKRVMYTLRLADSRLDYFKNVVNPSFTDQSPSS